MASAKLIIPPRDEILELCSAPGGTLVHTPEGGLPLFLKFGPLVLNEARTQEYMYNQAAADPDAPRIPKIYDSFGNIKGYLVMEFIDAPTVKTCLHTDLVDAEHLCDKVAEAVMWLLERPIPANAVLGPVGGGSAQHMIFVDQVAPRPFASAKALEIYFNKALRWPRRSTPISVNFSHEPLTFYHSDISAANFLFDSTTDQLYIVDFQHVGIYPRSFASLPFYVRSTGFLKAIATRVNYWRSPNIAAMCQARYMFH